MRQDEPVYDHEGFRIHPEQEGARGDDAWTPATGFVHAIFWVSAE